MAYSFNGTDQSLTTNTRSGIVGPATLTCVFFVNTLQAQEFFQAFENGQDSGPGMRLIQRGEAQSYSVGADARGSGGSASLALSESAPSTNTYYRMTGVLSSSPAELYFGGSTFFGLTTVNPNMSTTVFRIGRSAAGAFLVGRIAEVAAWSVALTMAEMASLEKGFSPRRIRPQSLVFYAPLIRTAQDVRGGLTITNNNGATVANHPRVY